MLSCQATLCGSRGKLLIFVIAAIVTKEVLPSSSPVISFRLKRNDRNDLFNSNGRKKKLTTRFPITTVARKKGTQTYDATHMQTHMDSIHSPHRTRKTIMKLCMKSTKFQRGTPGTYSLSLFSG